MRCLCNKLAVGLRHIAGEARFRWDRHVVLDGPMQAVLPHRKLATGQIAEEAALRLVALGDRVLVGALERDAVQTPHPKVVPTPGDHIDG